MSIRTDDDRLTAEITERAKREVTRDFATWLDSHGRNELATWSTRTAKCYITETNLAALVARTVAAYGCYVARGALIEHAATLSGYIERDSFNAECVAAFWKRGI